MSIYPIVLHQKQFVHRDRLIFSYDERGLQFGDGVYEVIRIYNGKYYLLDEHVDRLYQSLKEIRLIIPFSPKQLKDMLHQLIIKNRMKEHGRVYLQVTRGAAPREHTFPQNIEPSIYAYVESQSRNIKDMLNGVHVITMPDIRWEYCHVKSLNLLPNVMAKQEAKEKGCFEALLHKNGFVTECSAANVFLVLEGKVYTYPKSNHILNGCVRMLIERLAKMLDIPFIEAAFTINDIDVADEMFLTSSTTEVTPIVKVDNQWIQNGKPGPITRKLQKAYAEDANIESIFV